MAKIDISDNLNAFSDNLVSLMDSHGINTVQLTDQSGIANANIIRYKNKTRVPRIDNIIQIAKFFDVSIDWLLGLSDSENGRMSKSSYEVAELYSMASPEDKAVIDMILAKYKSND